MAPQTRAAGKKRGEYRRWQFDRSQRIPRSTLHSRRTASKGIKKAKSATKKIHVPKRAAPAAACKRSVSSLHHQSNNSSVKRSGPSQRPDTIDSGGLEEENLSDKENICPQSGSASHSQKENICPQSGSASHSQKENICPQSGSASHSQTENWDIVIEDDSDREGEGCDDEEEPFILRLHEGDDDCTDDVISESNVEGDETDSDEELAVAPDFHLGVPESVKLLLLLATKKRHNLSYTAAEDVMDLAGVLEKDQNLFHPSRHMMKAAIDKFSFGLTEHHVCPNCTEYFGIVTSHHFYCKKCHEKVSTKKNRRKGYMFLYLPIREQIKALLETLDDEDFNYLQDRKKINESNYEDIHDGARYKKMKVRPETLTFNFFVDGLQIATTSKQSAWPVLLTINELPLHLRRKHVLMACVWLSKKKPNCNQYLKPFVKECIYMATNGVMFQKPGITKTVKVKPFMCISDSIARPLLRNSTQFNGKYGCGLCYHPGVRMARGRGETRSYSTKDRTYQDRTHEELMEYAARADMLGERQKGIKGKSILADLPDFDMVSCIDLDSFHAIVNVAKRFCYLWFDKKSSGKAYCIRGDIDEVDRRLLAVKTNSDISRAPRPIKERSDFRGHEWFYFVLIYSVPVLKNILPARYLNHWSLLVHGLSLVMQNSVAKSEVVYSGRFLNQFVSEIDDLYGAAHVTFSIHLLTHFEKSIVNFSQPWTHSAFIYESYMNEIKTAVKSSNGAAIQISKAMQLNFAVKKMEIEFSQSISEHQKCYLDRMLSRGKRLAPPHLILQSCSFLGKPTDTILSLEAKRAISRAGVQFSNTLMSVPVYERCMLHNVVYHSTMYSKVSKQDNSVVLLESGDVFLIESFIIIQQDSFMLGYYYPRSKKKLVDVPLPHFYVLADTHESILRCVRHTQVACKLIAFNVDISDSERLHVACVNVLKLEMLS